MTPMSCHPVLLQPRASAADLDADHRVLLLRAISNVLSTELAEITMAQLIDGLPLGEVALDTRGTYILQGHPIREHTTLCGGSLEAARKYRDEFDLYGMTFPATPLQHFQNASPMSRECSMRLVELVACILHDIGVRLFRQEPKLHEGDQSIESVTLWRYPGRWHEVVRPNGEIRRVLKFPQTRPAIPTLFHHPDYLAIEQYPNGLADMAGYWAEDRILGGVANFDRGESGDECKDLYFLCARHESTFRVWRLLDSQFDALIEFLCTENLVSPLPIEVSDNNRHRYDSWDAIALHGIYRDIWEREVPRVKPDNGRDVRSSADYPELIDLAQTLHDLTDGLDEDQEIEDPFPFIVVRNRRPSSSSYCSPPSPDPERPINTCSGHSPPSHYSASPGNDEPSCSQADTQGADQCAGEPKHREGPDDLGGLNYDSAQGRSIEYDIRPVKWRRVAPGDGKLEIGSSAEEMNNKERGEDSAFTSLSHTKKRKLPG